MIYLVHFVSKPRQVVMERYMSTFLFRDPEISNRHEIAIANFRLHFTFFAYCRHDVGSLVAKRVIDFLHVHSVTTS